MKNKTASLLIIILITIIIMSMFFNLQKVEIDKPTLTNIKLSLKPNYEFGNSPVEILNNTVPTQISSLANTMTITYINITAIVSYKTNVPVNKASIKGEINIIFDGVNKKIIQLNVTQTGSEKFEVGKINLSSQNITGWDSGFYTNHTLTVSTSRMILTTEFENDQINTDSLNSTQITFILRVTRENPESNIIYTISDEQNQIAVKNPQGKIIFFKDFGNLINSFNNILKEGDIINIKSGKYYVSESSILKINNISIIGSENTTLVSEPSLDSYFLKVTGSNITINNIKFDAKYNDNISPVVMITGKSDTVQNCKFNNSIQYCLLAYGATNFKFINNYINKSQYGISTGGGKGYPFCMNGLIANNTIIDSRDCGIKLRWAINVTVKGNVIDTGYLTWGESNIINGMWGSSFASDSPVLGCEGIRFYQADGPDINCTVKDNFIYDSKKTTHTCGIEVDNDLHLDDPNNVIKSSGQVIVNNTINDTYYGIVIKYGKILVGEDKNGLVTGNIISNVRYDGILLGWTTNSASYSHVMGNYIKNSKAYGIEITKNTDYCIISRNSIINSGINNIKNDGSNNIIN